MADQLYGLQVIDISDPTSPRHVGANAAFAPLDVVLHEGRLVLIGEQWAGADLAQVPVARKHIGIEIDQFVTVVFQKDAVEFITH